MSQPDDDNLNGQGGGDPVGRIGEGAGDAAKARRAAGAPAPATDWTGKQVFTTGEAAQICKISQQTIIRCFDSGRLQGFRVPGSKFRRIPRSELIRFMRDNDIPLDVIESPRRRVLVVDDDPQIVRLFEDLLSGDARFEVKSAANGYDAGLLTESFKPHLVILDYMLPDINGDLVCRRIRAGEATADAKIVFVSGVVAPDEVNKLMAAGANAFLKKPFDIDALAAQIYALLDMEPPAGSARPAKQRRAGA